MDLKGRYYLARFIDAWEDAFPSVKTWFMMAVISTLNTPPPDAALDVLRRAKEEDVFDDIQDAVDNIPDDEFRACVIDFIEQSVWSDTFNVGQAYSRELIRRLDTCIRRRYNKSSVRPPRRYTSASHAYTQAKLYFDHIAAQETERAVDCLCDSLLWCCREELHEVD